MKTLEPIFRNITPQFLHPGMQCLIVLGIYKWLEIK
jgi:hypothetical protein